ncbi:helix-turn-helix transcriptional regulator [Halorussus lipolyticus]|uniref:helix-turn-helix transcriptional regulator n=1 Tax=Halorussus lipolyticus TaxID=3034024 RepID=UPI0023E7BEA4|nr:hypothetical protein [Halorussus sp. DT80]
MRSSAALLVVLLVVSSVAGVAAGLSPEDQTRAPHAVSDSSADTGPVPATAATAVNGTVSNATVRDGTDMYVSIGEHGNARWNVTARFVLRDANETEAFRKLARQYRNGNADVGFTRKTFQRAVERARSDSERSMALRNVSRTARLGENGTVGRLSLSFTWRNFTRIEDDRILLDDAFWTGSNTWLPALTDDQTLTIVGPSSHYVTRSNVPHNGTRISYHGPRKFERGDFSVTFSPKNTGPTNQSDFPDLSSLPGLLLVLLVFGLGASGVYAWSQRRGADPAGTGAVEESDDPRGPSATASVTAGQESDAEDDGDEDDDDEADVELLSDEERVLRLLRENDGRMKQGQIVTETNWSNAKVSQLLSKMDENDDVDKLRIGRENLITLPDEDVADVN